MPSIFIQVPTNQVFEAMCDLTRHAKWAAHAITIGAEQEGPPAVGNTYTSVHKEKAPDRLTVTEMAPNERFVFHSVMSNNWELDITMTSVAQGDGTLVTRGAKGAKTPLPMKLLLPLVGGATDKKLLKNMKAELEGAG